MIVYLSNFVIYTNAMYVVKADGRREEFDRSKIVRTCLRMGVPREVAEEIAAKVEQRSYDGISTREILQIVFELLSKHHHPSFRHRESLRDALSALRPKPDFEQYVRLFFREQGYTVLPNQIVRGRCLDYELDGIIEINGKKYMLEVKHHVNSHTRTGLEVCLAIYAKLLDLNKGYELGVSTIKFDGAIVVCNTKFTFHAIKYSECAGLILLGWNYPKEKNLSTLIEKMKLYPITYVKGFDKEVYEKLGDSGIVLLKQVVSAPVAELARVSGLDEELLSKFKEKAREILSKP
ncbi:MAG: restriction endonuclease [Thermoprotei archaeon]|nr:MAG: restriction endonuclease [Thermoprotei archaeon]